MARAWQSPLKLLGQQRLRCRNTMTVLLRQGRRELSRMPSARCLRPCAMTSPAAAKERHQRRQQVPTALAAHDP
eukprot:3659378-Amphidinium_carterae.1